jgi:hypothetical protein
MTLSFPERRLVPRSLECELRNRLNQTRADVAWFQELGPSRLPFWLVCLQMGEGIRLQLHRIAQAAFGHFNDSLGEQFPG